MVRFSRIGLVLLLAGALAGPAGAQAWPAADMPDLREPLRIGVVGMVHGHVGGFLRRQQESEAIRVVGVAEADQALARRYMDRFGLEGERLYADVEHMLDETDPEAVVVFTNTFDHRRVVEACARRGIDVMMEKPLAVSVAHARAMQEAAREGDIHVLVNYETTWYPSNQQTYEMAREQHRLGPLRKIVARDGHQGPKEIGVGPAFLSWLTDPRLNGGGALMDFGCYGANLMTWLMSGRRPTVVRAVTQQLKSDSVYAEVDDEATLVLTYPEAQGIIQASWNWPYARKDLSVYGQRGYVHADNATDLRVRVGEGEQQQVTAEPVSGPRGGPLAYLAAVVRGDREPSGLSSLDNNLIVTEILEAARQSAQTGRAVPLKRNAVREEEP